MATVVLEQLFKYSAPADQLQREHRAGRRTARAAGRQELIAPLEAPA